MFYYVPHSPLPVAVHVVVVVRVIVRVLVFGLALSLALCLVPVVVCCLSNAVGFLFLFCSLACRRFLIVVMSVRQ